VHQNISPFVKKIIVATKGLEGFELYNPHKDEIDLVVSDILMPILDGISMVDKIRAVDSDIPVIYTTAFNDTDYIMVS